jgi:DNA-binding winged helix-turn-helix (wHTH) protein/tetratricopeptide (TPR) repeat protein
MSPLAVLRFGPFELDSGAGELRQHGDVVKLAPQPLKVLEMLARRGGEVVTRADIRERVWSGDTFVDFEQGLNFCIRQVREALGDSAHAPRYVETLPRRGYRFLMPVTKTDHGQPAAVKRLIVLPFRMLRPDADTEFLAFSLPDALAGSLSGLESLVVRSSLVAAKFVAGADAAIDPKQVAAEADVDLIVTGTLLRSGDDVRVSAQLSDARSGTLLWSGGAQAKACDLFAVQDDLAQRIVSSLSLPLSERDQRQLKRDVPASPQAYEFFLRGNQLSHDPKQYVVARDLYLRAVEEDPAFAPAWARLGRIHHVMAKYVETGQREGFDRAEQAFRRALDLNPDLTIAHKMYAQLEVDFGRARDAMARLLERGKTVDPEVLAGLVTTCRYCGLLDASTAAHARAVALEPRIKTSVPHTWFFQGDYAKVSTLKFAEYPYITALAYQALGRGAEALAALREVEQNARSRVPGFVIAGRTLLEGNRIESIAAVERILGSGFSDPEGLFYAARHLAHLGESDRALAVLDRVIQGGFFGQPTLAADPWLISLRKKAAFTRLMKKAEEQHTEAKAIFKKRSQALSI